MRRKKIRRHYWQYLPEYLMKGFVLFLLTAWVLSEVLYWRQYSAILDGFRNTSDSYGFREMYTMLKQASLEEQEADYFSKLIGLMNSAELQTRMTRQKMYGYSAIVDAKTGEVLLDTERDAVFLRIKGYDEDFINPTYPTDISTFVCYDPAVQEPWHQIEIWQEELEADQEQGLKKHGWITGVSFQDFYIQGDRFQPGKVTAHISRERYSETGHDTIERSMEYDFTPENPEVYQHFLAEEFEKCYLSDYRAEVTDYQVNDTVEDPLVHRGPEIKAQALELYRKNEKRSIYGTDKVGIPTKHPVFAFLDWEMTYFNSIPGVRMEDGQQYLILIYWKYGAFDPAQEDGIWFLLGWIAVGILVLMLFVAWLDYLIHRYRILTGEYRRILADTMAQDLKIPLMTIGGCAEKLKVETQEEKRESYAEGILNSVSYMDELVKRNLELLNLEPFRKPLKKTKVDLKALCGEILKKYEPEIDIKQLEIRLSGEMTVKADTALIERVLDNLISNAVKYSTEKSLVELVFRKNEFQIRNRADLEYTGRLSKLWDPLTWENTGKSGNGAGLGLTIAAYILDRHKWKYKLSYEKEEKIFCCRIRIPAGLLF